MKRRKKRRKKGKEGSKERKKEEKGQAAKLHTNKITVLQKRMLIYFDADEL